MINKYLCLTHNFCITHKFITAVSKETRIITRINYSGVGPYDIGLIELKTPLNLTSKQVQPITLPEEESDPTGDAILCGWGSTSSGHFPVMPDKLQYINLVYINRTICHQSVERLTGSSPVHETNVCTGPLTGGISACSVSFAHFHSFKSRQ